MQSRTYALSSLVSGVVWFLLCYFIDAGGLAGYSLIPRGVIAFVLLLLCGAATGLLVARLYGKAIDRKALSWGLLLPLATVPTGVLVFAILLWAVRLGFGYQSGGGWPVAGEFLNVLGILLSYIVVLGLYPLVYFLALANQWILRRMMKV